MVFQSVVRRRRRRRRWDDSRKYVKSYEWPNLFEMSATFSNMGPYFIITHIFIVRRNKSLLYSTYSIMKMCNRIMIIFSLCLPVCLMDFFVCVIFLSGIIFMEKICKIGGRLSNVAESYAYIQIGTKTFSTSCACKM